MVMLRTVPAIVASLLLSFPAAAGSFPTPHVEYAADSVTRIGARTISSRVFHAGGKERRELVQYGQLHVSIVRPDKGLIWTLIPAEALYMELPIAAAQDAGGDFANYDVRSATLGPEQINGIDTLKYKVIMTSPQSITYDGHLWVTEENIVIKLDVWNGSEYLRMDLNNIRIGEQDERLFEVPEGYRKMESGGVGGGSYR